MSMSDGVEKMETYLKITHGQGTEYASFIISKIQKVTIDEIKTIEELLIDRLTGDNPVMSVVLENGNTLILPKNVLLNCSIEICRLTDKGE